MAITNINKKRRMRIILFSSFLLLMALIIRIGWIQFIQGASLQELAYKQQTLNRIISPKRGTIYDSTGKVLAMSWSVETVTVNPTNIKPENKEKVARAFTDIFALDYDATLTKVQKNSSIETIIKKVDKEKTDQLRLWMKENNTSAGINIDEDTTRYYPYNNLGSSIIGFCGADNQGLSGLELQYENILKGTSGKIVTSTNAVGQEIPNGEERYIPAEDGSNLVLTIDHNVQSIVEKHLKQAVIDNKCTDGGNIIIMNPKTGDIIAMAGYPDFNLNDPFTPNTDALKNQWDSFDSKQKTEELQKMWRNKAVSDTYEPGSTFKLITTSAALEEGITTPNKPGEFSCTGSIEVAGVKMKCWRYYNPHGPESLTQALGNSCNPVFIALGQKLGVPTYYKYLKAFNLMDKTGIDLPGEAKSIFLAENKVGPVELATISFGQRFEITPLQLITAVGAIANDGVLMQPRLVKQTVTNGDTPVTTDIAPVSVRQVISKKTAEEMRTMMEYVATDGTAKNAQVKGYTVGGKTGTSEDGVNTNKYVTSFIGIAPVSSTEVVILITLYNPVGEGGHQGGSVAAPIGGQILKEVLPYLGISSDGTHEVGETSTSKMVPDIRNKTVTEAIKILQDAGFKVQSSVKGDKNTTLVTDQVPKPGIKLSTNAVVLIYTEETDVRVSVAVPSLKGMTAAQATNALKAKNLNVSISGTGKVNTQEPAAGTSVEEGTVVNIVLKEDVGDVE